MMKLEDCKVAFAAVGLVGVLILASPTLGLVLHLPGGEKFSELWVLGSSHMIENYPLNVKAGEVCKVFLGVSNHMGSLSYYVIKVKFRNQTEPLPDSEAGIASPLPALYEYHVVIPDGESWETKLTFSVLNVSAFENRCAVGLLKINNSTFTVDKMTLWDVNRRGYYYQPFFELWIYDGNLGTFHFHNRFVNFWLNVTV